MNSSLETGTTLSTLRYGNIAFELLQDIELAVISMKEVKYMLAEHYHCKSDTSLGDQIATFSSTTSIGSDVKDRLSRTLKGLLFERNKVVHEEGYNVLSDRQRFINQSMEVFLGLSPRKNGVRLSPARYSVLYPCPDEESAAEDYTFIDYDQYEDISIAIIMTKRLDSILKEVFHQNGHDLHAKIQDFPYDLSNIKRKMSQANAIRNKLIHERLVNNFENRTEFINLSRSIFATLMAIVEIESNRGTHFGNMHNIDMLSNTTDTNDITTNLSESTYKFSVNRYLKPFSNPPSSSQWTNNYDKIPSLSTIPGDAEECNKRHNEKVAGGVGAVVAPQYPRATGGYLQIRMNDGGVAVKRDRQVRRNNRLFAACKHCTIALSIVGVFAIIAFLLLKFWLKVI